MTSQQARVELEKRLNEVLGSNPTATLWSMISDRDDVVTTGDLVAVRDDLRGEISDFRTEIKGDIAGLRNELKGDIAGLQTELKGELTDVRSELRFIRQEMELKYATKADLVELKNGFDASFHSYVRTFIATQAATVVGVTGIVYALTRLT